MAPQGLGPATSLSRSDQKWDEQSCPRLRPWSLLRPRSTAVLRGPSVGVLCVLHPNSSQPLRCRPLCSLRLLGAPRLSRAAGAQAFLLRPHHQLPRWLPSSPQ